MFPLTYELFPLPKIFPFLLCSWLNHFISYQLKSYFFQEAFSETPRLGQTLQLCTPISLFILQPKTLSYCNIIYFLLLVISYTYSIFLLDCKYSEAETVSIFPHPYQHQSLVQILVNSRHIIFTGWINLFGKWMGMSIFLLYIFLPKSRFVNSTARWTCPLRCLTSQVYCVETCTSDYLFHCQPNLSYLLPSPSQLMEDSYFQLLKSKSFTVPWFPLFSHTSCLIC